MKIKHKVQRKLDPTFQAELKLCSLCGPTTWWQWVVCAGSGDGLWRWLSGAHLCGRCTCGVRGGVGISTSGLQWAVQCCSLRPPWWAGCGWGLWFLWIWDWASFPPSLHGLPQKSSQVPGSPPILSEPCIYSTCVWASFGFVFLSQSVVPKIVNLRNHPEADTDANTWGFIYKLELVCKYTGQSGAGTWTPRWVLA